MTELAQIQLPGGSLQVPTGIQHLQGNLPETGKRVFQLSLDLLFYFAAILAIISIVISGIQWITSVGDPSKIASAKKRLLYSIIGLVVVAGAFLIVKVILSILGVEGAQLFI